MYERVTRSFSVLTDCVYIFWQKEIGKKAAHKMLVKMTPRLNLRKVLSSSLKGQLTLAPSIGKATKRMLNENLGANLSK